MLENIFVADNKPDVNEIMVSQVDADSPIIVFGCGGGGTAATNLLKNQHKEVSAYCEGEPYWKEGKIFFDKEVLNVKDVVKKYRNGTIIVAATGPEVLDLINDIFVDKDAWKVYSYVDRAQLYRMGNDWCHDHIKELEYTYNLLEDALSKKTFLSFLDARANCISNEYTKPLFELWNSKQYFNELYPKNMYEKHVMVDCGAWIGDTVEGFIEFINLPMENISVKAFEMDDNNYKILSEATKKYGNVDCYHCGVGDRHEIVYFESHSDASNVVDYSTDHKVEIMPVDEVMKDCHEKVSFVKMDLEGFERKALAGMEKLIKRDMPMLAICVYHKIDDLIVIPKFIVNLVKENAMSEIGYKYYLRHHSHNAAELVFYAVPYKK